MTESTLEPITKRIRLLTSLVSRSGLNDSSNKGLTAQQFIGHETLLDGLLLLYDECNNEQLKKEENVAAFVDKFRGVVTEVKKLRVNLNDFEQKKVIGKGHFGVVQVVREKATGNVFALKILRKSETLSQKHVAFYEEERDIMAKATSPWLTHLQYAFQDDQQLYLVMDFHPGGDLLSLLDRYDNVFDEDMTRFYLAEVTQAIHTLHSMGYVHRDIKPENILIDRCGHIKLADFGSAAKLTSSGIVRSKMPVGTPDYIAPEVLFVNEKPGSSMSYGVECDFWSLGIMAYEMCYGYTPFRGDNVVATYNNIMNHQKNLEFNDEENAASSQMKDLIKGLLKDSNHRLTYPVIIQHNFFLHVNWNDVRNSQPPFVPVVNSVDDTSNFEEFENERRVPDVDAFRTRHGFTGKNLPFIGFTYSRHTEHPEAESRRISICQDISAMEESMKEPSHLEAQLKAQKKENHELRLQLKDMTDSELHRQTLAMKKKIVEAETRVTFLEKERQRLEDENVAKEKVAASYKRDLALERKDRLETERKTVNLVRDMKNKWQKDQVEKLQAYRDECEMLQSLHKEALAELARREEVFRKVGMENQKLQKLLDKKEKADAEKSREVIEKDCVGNCQVAADSKQRLESLNTELKEKKEEWTSKHDVLKEEKTKIAAQLEETLINLEKISSENAFVNEGKKLLEKQVAELEMEVENIHKKLLDAEEELQNAKEQESLERKNHVKALEDHLAEEKRECASLRKELKSLTDQLNESRYSLASLDSTSIQKEEEHSAKIRELDQELKRTMADKVSLQSQLSAVRTREGEHQTKIAELELLLKKLDETVHNLESKKSSSEAIEETYQTKIQLLEAQLSSAQTAHSQDKEKLKKTSEELQAIKQELSDSKLDIRVAEREAKSAQDTISYLREKVKEQRSQLGEKDESIKSASENADGLQANIEKLENSIKALEEEKEKQKGAHQENVAVLQDKIKALQDASKASGELEKKLNDALQLCDRLKLEKRGLESQIKMAEAGKDDVKKEIEGYKKELADLNKKLQHSESVISQLKEVCSTQDEELTEMMALHDKIKEHDEETARLQEEIEKLKSEVKASKCSVNEEKSLKFFQEKKVKDLEARMASIDEEHNEQILQLNDQLKEYTNTNTELHEQVDGLERDLETALLSQRSVERDLSLLHGQYERLKEESEGHIKHIHTLKESNFNLTEGLEEAICKAEGFKKRIEEVETLKADVEALHEDERLKMRSTIDQQGKLIDFLQTKIDNPKKKKKMKSKLFGKENKENTGYVMPHQYHELEDLLVQERSNNRNLHEQITKARAEIVALKSSTGTLDNRSLMGTPSISRKPLASYNSTPSTAQSKRSLYNGGSLPSRQENSLKRMRHNIPHRWQSALQMRAARCSGCMGSIPFARNAAKCQECGIVAHSKCSTAIPSTCGLPIEFAEHYSGGWTTDSPQRSSNPEADQYYVMQGWVKIPRPGKACWDSRYVCVEKDELLIFDQELTGGIQPLSKFSLNRPDGSATIISAVPRSEQPNTSSVDLPYVLKIEISAKKPSDQSDSLYLMTTNFEEKQSWVMALEGIVAQLPKSEVDSSQKERVHLDVLYSSNNPVSLDVNSLIYITEKTVIIGAAEGLYSFEVQNNGTLKSRARIEGLVAIHQILVVQEAGVVLFIAGNDNLVYKVDKSVATVTAEAGQVAKPSLDPERIEPLQGCHLLACGSTKAGHTFICAAASDRISILTWNEPQEKFTVCRQYSTQEPCSCLHFTQATLIVGAEKFYEIDLKTFEIEEFLDETDSSLAYAIYGSAQMSSFPVAILQVSKAGKYEEYLLCFYEFAVFVDACGQRSREHDIKFTRLPIAIVFQRPYLYIVHQNAVEVIEIRQDSFTKVTTEAESDSDCSPCVRMASQTMPKPSFIGVGQNPRSILVTSKSHDKLEVIQVSANFPDDCDMSSSWGTLPNMSEISDNKSDTVSVTSSEVDPSANRKVHFSVQSSVKN
ncbi:citron rho-interacting kinase-like [Macrobrachium rosenbergii]|uniref:citron rho-interacting kinase-like n=1 Tax=Macrobrachium rosenbergii TaxID=79674 RepID=UPI0034D512A4